MSQDGINVKIRATNNKIISILNISNITNPQIKPTIRPALNIDPLLNPTKHGLYKLPQLRRPKLEPVEENKPFTSHSRKETNYTI